MSDPEQRLAPQPMLRDRLGRDRLPTCPVSTSKAKGLWIQTDARIALFSFMKIPLPRAAAPADPTKRAPSEQIDKSRRAFSDEGRNEDAWTMGKMG